MSEDARRWDGAGWIAVAGAAGGIGSALVRRLAQHSQRVLVVSRDRDRGPALARELGLRHVAIDGVDPWSLQPALADALAGEPLGGLAHCIGNLLLKPAQRTTREEWQQVIDANLTSAFVAAQAAAQLIRAGGALVLTASAAARVGIANHEAIAAAKAGVIGLALATAAGNARRNLRCNVVAPGLVATPLTAAMLANPITAEAVRKNNPLQRVGSADEVAAVMEFLLDPANSWINGQVIGVDGGLASLRTPGA